MNPRKQWRAADPLGIERSLEPRGVLPQQADRLSVDLPLAEDELGIQVECLNIDSASFHQLIEECEHDLARLEWHILELVRRRGKHHNPVTGSGGMLIGTVTEVGPRFPVHQKPVQVGDRIATLVSLTLTPLRLEKILKIHPRADRVDVVGRAILFASGLFSVLPKDLPEKLSLAILDVAGAPAQARALARPGETVLVVGGGGKSGLLCLYEAKKKGARTIALDYSAEAVERLRSMSFVDQVIQADARQALKVRELVLEVNSGHLADLVINVANLPETELSCILSCRDKGIVYFFSMATSFTRAALGAEGVGADVDLRIGNGYTKGHADLALGILRESPEIRKFFERAYS